MYLLDTHAIIWYVSGSNELSSTAKISWKQKDVFSVLYLYGKLQSNKQKVLYSLISIFQN